MVRKLVQDIADKVLAQVPWLQVLYAETALINNDEGIKPAALLVTGEYISVFPSDEFKAMGYFEVLDPIEFTQDKRYKFRADLIVWLDTRILDIVTVERHRRISPADLVREDLIVALDITKHNTTYVEIGRVYEHFSSIYGKYTISERDTQFMMHPYHAVKIELSITQRDRRCNR